MTRVNVTNDKDIDDLTCPITMELFRDPVTASDGRVYEREAITKWINEHGTSPFTRQPLRVEDLKSDPYLKVLASKRRNSTVSYNARDHIVTLPPLKRPPNNSSRRTNAVPIREQYQTHPPSSDAFRNGCSGLGKLFIILFAILCCCAPWVTAIIVSVLISR